MFENIREKVLDEKGLKSLRAKNPDKKIIFCWFSKWYFQIEKIKIISIIFKQKKKLSDQ